MRDQVRLALHHPLQQTAIGRGGADQIRVVAGEDVVGERAQAVDVAARGEELEGPHPDVASGHAGQDRPRPHPLAEHPLAGGDCRERPGGDRKSTRLNSSHYS